MFFRNFLIEKGKRIVYNNYNQYFSRYLMSYSISRKAINAFIGEVFAVYLISDNNEIPSQVKWESDSESLKIRKFNTGDEYGTEAGIVAVATNAGCYTVKATIGGEEYVCRITARQMKTYDGKTPLNYYRGDMHVHTSMDHCRETFAKRDGESPYDMLKTVKDEGTLDFTVISDHGDVLCEKEFLKGFIDAERIEPIDTVIFPGSESEANVYVTDRFGTIHKHSGEVVMINTMGYSGSVEWDGFLLDHKESPAPVGVFAHPQVVGSDGSLGLWNNDYARIKDNGLDRFMRLVEIGNGEDRGENLIHEYSYTDALDAGFKVSVSVGSDSHGPVYGSKVCTGKTVIMATEKTKEAMLDALLSNRAYATESGNVMLSYSVNGQNAPATLESATAYYFKVDISYFEEDCNSEIVKCQVISDYGNKLITIPVEGCSSLSFSICSNTARYFYLRLVDRLGRKTWSMPIWTGREFDKYREKSYDLIPYDNYKAYDEVGNDLSVIKNDNIWRDHIFDGKSASVILELNEDTALCALGITHKKLSWADMRAKGEKTADYLQGFVSKYRISVSSDGKEYKEVKRGVIKVFGDEVILDFAPTSAKFIKFEALSTVGYESDFPKYLDANVRIANISIYN